jgi:hypothetical protein
MLRRSNVLGFPLVATLACGGAREDSEPAPPEPIAEPIAVASPEAEPPSHVTTEPEPEPPPEPEPAAFTPATHGKGTCKVTVSALLEAEEYRGGGPMTPALAASLDADPDFARMYNAESHGDHHVQCVYEVTLAHEPHKRYRWRTWFDNMARDKSAEDCKGMAAEVAQDIIETTKKCRDLDAGAYWGFVLEPM